MKDFLIGHANDEHTGVTVVIAPEGAVGGVDVRGGAPGTRETDLMRGANAVEKIHAVCLCGGSAFGLEACCGVMEHLHARNIGFATYGHTVPIVTGAVIYDLLDKDLHYPNKEMGARACAAATADESRSGSIGVGKGATVGKILGRPGSKGGVGMAELSIMGATVKVVVAVNAFGDVYDAESGAIVAGARRPDGAFLDTNRVILTADFAALKGGTNTTIGVVLTDAAMTREQANKLASIAHDGLAQAIKPVHTMADGDTMFAMSSGTVTADFNAVCVAAVEATRRAILAAVRQS